MQESKALRVLRRRRATRCRYRRQGMIPEPESSAQDPESTEAIQVLRRKQDWDHAVTGSIAAHSVCYQQNARACLLWHRRSIAGTPLPMERPSIFPVAAVVARPHL